VYQAAVFAGLVVGSITGCFNPGLADGQFACDENLSCPVDFTCVSGSCRRSGDTQDAAADAREFFDAAVDADPDEPDAEAGLADAAKPGADASGFTAVYLNINGPLVNGIDFPGAWASDNGTGDACNGQENTYGGGISGTVDDELFRHLVFETTGNDFSCSIPNIPDGSYTVTLLWGEVFFGSECAGGGGVGSRVFSVYAEASLKVSALDVYNEGGGCVAASMTAQPVVRQFTVTVSDGSLDLSFEVISGQGGPFISAISIEAASE